MNQPHDKARFPPSEPPTGGKADADGRHLGAARTAAVRPPSADPAIAGTAAAAQSILEEVEKAVVGKRRVLELVLSGLLADGHVLLDDVPGVAKTLMARSFATAAGLTFSRVQFTPDLLPADITGATVLDLATNTPVFRPGPVFAQLLLGDEVNRAPAKTQSALLEAMQERQVTADGTTHRLPRPFLVVATQNPIESEGTYPLPEAQLDRFILRTTVGYPSPADEMELLSRRFARQQEEPELAPVVTAAEFRAMQASVEHVHIEQSLREYAVALVTETREDGRLVGMARLVGDGLTIVYLQDILVAPSHQRIGIGRQLFHRVLEPFSEVRQKVVVTDDEPGQRAFYEALGFTEIRDLKSPIRAFVQFNSGRPAPR